MTTVAMMPLIIVLAVASVTDLKRGIIPNRLIIFGFCAALVQQVCVYVHTTGSLRSATLTAIGAYALGAVVWRAVSLAGRGHSAARRAPASVAFTLRGCTWVTFHLNPRDCAACCGAETSACCQANHSCDLVN